MALVNNGTKTGVHIVTAKGPDYKARSEGEMADILAMGVFSGAGPHAFFMQTWSAGLAYSNGMRARPKDGSVRYYAERCPDLVQTMRFVAGLATHTPLHDPFLVEYSLANAFSDYRGAGDFSGRGHALAEDLQDGRSPDTVRGFKTKLMQAARKPGILEEVARRMPSAVGRVLVGYGPKVSKAPGTSAFVIGPDELLDRWEAHLKEQGEADRLIRLCPRDFWE